MTDDWFEFIAALLDANARFLIVGAHALAAHGVPRATQDLDVWIDCSAENTAHVWSALRNFGAPTDALGVSPGDLRARDTIVQFGVAPNRIDLMTSISGVSDFEVAWSGRIERIVRGRSVPFIGRDALTATKRATGRHKDLGDLEALGERVDG